MSEFIGATTYDVTVAKTVVRQEAVEAMPAIPAMDGMPAVPEVIAVPEIKEVQILYGPQTVMLDAGSIYNAIARDAAAGDVGLILMDDFN